MSNNTQKREYKTLLQVLASGNPNGASALLKKYSGETAQNSQELANKLARAYASAPYKKDIEKDFAECHPHRDFILKYTEPKVIIKEVKAVETEPVVVKLPETLPQIANTEQTAGANGMGMAWGRGIHAPCGNPNCPYCNRYFSNASGCNCGSSNASGENQNTQNNNSVIIFGLVSIVAIFGLVLTLKNNNK
jgi:hypothetical protein